MSDIEFFTLLVAALTSTVSLIWRTMDNREMIKSRRDLLELKDRLEKKNDFLHGSKDYYIGIIDQMSDLANKIERYIVHNLEINSKLEHSTTWASDWRQEIYKEEREIDNQYLNIKESLIANYWRVDSKICQKFTDYLEMLHNAYKKNGVAPGLKSPLSWEQRFSRQKEFSKLKETAWIELGNIIKDRFGGE